ncbi:MAG TPA: Uma2 family endonuclease [Thermoanaerobaculia bacterium]
MSALPLEQEVEYPTSDGQPMAESPFHARVMTDLLFGLQTRYGALADAWEGINFFLYYEKGNSKARVSPDVMLAKGVARWDRQNYLLWKERPPSLIVEVTSRKTRRKDTGFKKDLYEQIGVEEYILFDPLGEYLRPQLQGYRLLRGRYQPIPLSEDGTLLGRTTGLRMKPEGRRLRLIDAATGERLLWPDEIEAAKRAAEAALREAEAARREAEARAQSAEARAKALEEELKRLRRS